MKRSEFYDSLKLIVDSKNTVALINIKEFKKLERIHGEYQWRTFSIGSLPAIPIKTSSFKENLRGTDEWVSIKITPVWTFLTNDKQIITPKIESFDFIEYNNSNPRYVFRRTLCNNPHYLSNSSWNNLFDGEFAKEENGIEWNKSSKSTLLSPTDKTLLASFLNIYEDELQEFNKIYEECSKTALEIRGYQKKIK